MPAATAAHTRVATQTIVLVLIFLMEHRCALLVANERFPVFARVNSLRPTHEHGPDKALAPTGSTGKTAVCRKSDWSPCSARRLLGAAEFVVQTAAEPRFVVDCRVNPVALVGQVKIIL